MKTLPKALTFVVTALALALPSNVTFAQATTPPRAADAADPKAAVPPLIYHSAFQSYRPNSPAEPGDWKAAHDQVKAAGGWRSYAKEAAQPDAPASSPAAHSGHKTP